MGREYAEIDQKMRRWLERQPLLFVATAPAGLDGQINLSPKGGAGTFKVLGGSAVAYVDLVGSGVETVAHLTENGRIVLMFCAFNGPPKIVRLHGTGRSVPASDPEYGALVDRFELDPQQLELARGIVVVDVKRISDSCGFGVPRMEVVDERDQLYRWAEQQHERHGDAWKARYMQANNRLSVDGLPGYRQADLFGPAADEALSSKGKAL